MRSRLALLGCAAALLAAGCSAGAGPTPDPGPERDRDRPPVRPAANPHNVAVGFSPLASGFASPVAITIPNDGTGRLFVVEQSGRIRVRTPAGGIGVYLDIRGRVLSGGERGLLGLAFHPAFASNGYLFVYYTDLQGDLTVSRFRASPSTSNTVSPSTEVRFLEIAHRDFSNHNGGQIAFKGGLLYIATGDGGSGGDPSGNAQSDRSLLGKILRINVDRACGTRRYCIPSSNPYAGSSTRRGEIWILGLRNPWRFSFDMVTANHWIADVGQNEWEEINRHPGGIGGVNDGWDCREGLENNGYGGSYCAGRAFTPPIYVYSIAGSSPRCAVIGGYVYRGARYRDVMGGVYLFADYCTGEVFGLVRSSSGTTTVAIVRDHPESITSFGESARTGELFAVDTAGRLFRVTASPR